MKRTMSQAFKAPALSLNDYSTVEESPSLPLDELSPTIDPVQYLPSEMAHVILDFLPTRDRRCASLVSRLWNATFKAVSSLGLEIFHSMDKIRGTVHGLHLVSSYLSQFKVLNKLSLFGPHITESVLLTIGTRCLTLETLKLKSTRITSFYPWLSAFPKLKRLIYKSESETEPWYNSYDWSDSENESEDRPLGRIQDKFSFQLFPKTLEKLVIDLLKLESTVRISIPESMVDERFRLEHAALQQITKERGAYHVINGLDTFPYLPALRVLRLNMEISETIHSVVLDQRYKDQLVTCQLTAAITSHQPPGVLKETAFAKSLKL